MVNQDTIKLLRECDSGIKMGVASIDEVIGFIKNDKLKSILSDNKNQHVELKKEVEKLLDEYCDQGKNPNPLIKGMSWMKTNVMLIMNESDNTIADLMTDGCNMGVKSLNKYLNQYKAADEISKDICKRLINLEEALTIKMRDYL